MMSVIWKHAITRSGRAVIGVQINVRIYIGLKKGNPSLRSL